MTYDEWKRKERDLERAVRCAAKVTREAKCTLAEKLKLRGLWDQSRETLRQHRLTKWDGLKP